MTNRKIVCLAVDDEPLALAVLKKYIDTIPALSLAGCCTDAVQALDLLERNVVDLIFLDIQMPLIMGTDFIRTLKKSPKIIFTTAYREYAVEGFELDAVDYLLKPVSFERFLKAVNKVLQTEMQTSGAPFQGSDAGEDVSASCIYVRADRKMVKVMLSDIIYIEGLSDYVKIITGSKTIITKQLLSSLEETLPKEKFLRIHRSYIISLQKIDSYNAEAIQAAGNELPVGRLFRAQVSQTLTSGSHPFPRTGKTPGKEKKN